MYRWHAPHTSRPPRIPCGGRFTLSSEKITTLCMCMQVSLRQQDQNFRRFLLGTDDPEIYEYVRHVFGSKCSLFLLITFCKPAPTTNYLTILRLSASFPKFLYGRVLPIYRHHGWITLCATKSWFHRLELGFLENTVLEPRSSWSCSSIASWQRDPSNRTTWLRNTVDIAKRHRVCQRF